MNATTTAELRDAATATAQLVKVRDGLKTAADELSASTDRLWDHVVRIRPQGLLTVDEMAEAIGRDRNYVDSIWSAHGETTKGKQTRVPVAEGVDAEAARRAYETLADAAGSRTRAASAVTTARAERDRVVAMVYGSKLLGPSAIASAVDVDRNHVLRIARKAGVKPVHRVGSKNQYTTSG
uniref:Helix-turn-helix DNA binding domain protein n=1 Tax=Streptomyces phage Geonosis TaxID=3158856 RepID=A0AAU7GXD0_9CAUD